VISKRNAWSVACSTGIPSLLYIVLSFSPGNEEDEKIHKKFHQERNRVRQVSLKGISSLKVVKEWLDGTLYVVSSSDKV
jgi:hypothetical protein